MLKAENVKKSFGDLTVLDGVSLQVDSKIEALVGLNGSGKSTLLKIIAGIVKPDEGQVWFGDHDMTDKPPEQRHIGYVPQYPALFKHLTVEDNICYALRNGRGSKQSFQEIVDLLGLREVLKKRPHELSGGYQSRTSLARALVPRPRVILLDEPLSSMDAATKEKLLPEFRRALKATTVPVLFVTHDAEEAKIIADNFTVIKDGKIQFSSSSEEAFKLM